MSACAVLHVTSFPGGGVDRHIRDIARGATRRHLVWHAADGADVIEIASERRFFPLDGAATSQSAAGLADWLRGQGVGIVHSHSVATAPRTRAAWVARALGVATIATLHDVLFLRREGFEAGASREPDPVWLHETSAFLATAAERIAPSEYLAALARRHLPAQTIKVIPNGSRRASRPSGARRAHPDFAARRIDNIAIVLGAVGPHKGARVLEETAGLLEGSDIGIVVIGYLDAQVDPGWRRPHLFVHGAYDDDEVAHLVNAYGAKVALFPNQVPESFSYALSDLWDAGLPAIVPPEGALAERVTRHEGGWLLPQGFSAREIVEKLRATLSPEGAEDLARVKSSLQRNDANRVPSLDDMTRSLDELYARFGIEPGAPLDTQSPPAQELLAKNLDGALFRQELVRVADEISQLKTGLAEERSSHTRFTAEAREWIAKLERDIAAMQEQLTAEVAERRRLDGENAEMANEIARLSVHKAAFELLPKFIRIALLRKIEDARG